MSDYYWEIIELDGTVTQIPPKAVEVVQRRLTNNDPIHLKTRSIPAKQIKSFQITSKPFGDQKLLEDAARAFKDPIFNDDGSIQVQWMKKPVTRKKYDSFYSNIPAYKRLGEENGMVMVAFKVATHEIDLVNTSYLTQNEINNLTNS